MLKKTRSRGPNFTSSESLLLCDIISEYKSIIENKKTDGANLQQKQEAWIKITEKFNAVTHGHHRTVESLQMNYKNLKKKLKKTASDAKMDIPVERATLVQKIEEYGTSSEAWEQVAASTGSSKQVCQSLFNIMAKEANTKDKQLKKHIMGTGGGPPPKCDDDPLLDKVKSLVGPTIDGVYTIYDGDRSLMELQNICPIEATDLEISSKKSGLEGGNQLLLNEENMDTDERPSQEALFFSNDRANLKRKPHVLLSRKQKLKSEMPLKQSVSLKFSSLATEKLELVALQKELLKCQLLEAKEKLQLRAMELEDAKKQYQHNELIRQLQLQSFNK